MTLDGIFNPNSAKENTLISLGGVFDNALEKYLETNSEVKEIIFCLDNDVAGREATQKLSQKYAEKGFDVKCIFPRLKDFNEDLKFYRQQSANAEFKAQNAVSKTNNVVQNNANKQQNTQQFSQI
jgi:DNA primase